MRPFILMLFGLAISYTGIAQKTAVYPFLKDDSTVKTDYYNRTLASKKKLLADLPKDHTKDYKEIYEWRSDAIADMMKSSAILTAPEAHTYLQSVLKNIVNNNPELKNIDLRVVFNRDIVPNAFSVGEGTVIVNAGFFIYLDNEAQLAFTLCHELAHQYLEHSNKKIRNTIELMHSDEVKKESKALAKQEYGQGQKLEELVKKYSFMRGRFSREAETEADRIGLQFMKRSGYDVYQAKTCLQLLDVIDDTTFYQPVKLKEIFQFDDYVFKKKWIENESSIFAAMNGSGDNILTKAEKDSMKTHPDCQQRIVNLEDSISKVNGGKKFTDEATFRKLQKQFVAELVEETYQNEHLGYHLYLSLQLMQKEEYRQYAVFTTVRTLNRLYEMQKTHRLGTVTTKESRFFKEDYNLLLRMIDRLKLEDIANLSYYFGKKYGNILSGNSEFEKELRKAEKLKSEN